MNDTNPNHPADDSFDELERRLSAVPLPQANLDRDGIMYAAGQAAERASRPRSVLVSRQQTFWKVGTFLSTSAALILAVMLAGMFEMDPSDAVTSSPQQPEQKLEQVETTPGTSNGPARIEPEIAMTDPLGLINDWPTGVPLPSSMLAMSRASEVGLPAQPGSVQGKPPSPLRSFGGSSLFNELRRPARF